MSVTYKPKKKKRKIHGFLSRKKTKAGSKVILKRLRRGRKDL